MVILHYFLGFPPYRSGGLTRFALDLMNSQSTDNEVIALWPGKIGFISNKTKIKKHKNYLNINNYELINPLPVSLDEGINNYDLYTKKTDKSIFVDFLKKINPDVIHIHTLMGLYSEFIDAAKELKIKTIFSTHDYFGLCSKVTLFKNGVACTSDNNCFDCVKCNYNALSYNKIRLLQSPIYRFLKESFIVKKLRKKHRQNTFNNIQTDDICDYKCNCDYKKLRKYYVDILEKIDLIHFNSSLTKSIYDKYVNIRNYKIINITHSNIKDNRENNLRYDDEIIRLIYLSPKNEQKGFNFIIKNLDELWNSGFKNFELNLFGISEEKIKPYMKVLGDSYDNNDLSKIFNYKDLLLAPSVLYETFGFTVIEALSNDIPVLVTENVGAKDIVDNCGFIIKPNDNIEFKNIIKKLNRSKINELKNNIKTIDLIYMNQFVNQIYELYR